jgi:hypothetical protein
MRRPFLALAILYSGNRASAQIMVAGYAHTSRCPGEWRSWPGVPFDRATTRRPADLMASVARRVVQAASSIANLPTALPASPSFRNLASPSLANCRTDDSMAGLASRIAETLGLGLHAYCKDARRRLDLSH